MNEEPDEVLCGAEVQTSDYTDIYSEEEIRYHKCVLPIGHKWGHFDESTGHEWSRYDLPPNCS